MMSGVASMQSRSSYQTPKSMVSTTRGTSTTGSARRRKAGASRHPGAISSPRTSSAGRFHPTGTGRFRPPGKERAGWHGHEANVFGGTSHAAQRLRDVVLHQRAGMVAAG